MTTEEAIRQIIREKEEAKEFPLCAMALDVVRLVQRGKQEVLADLVRLKEGKVIYTKKTLNSVSIYLNE